MPNFFPLGRGVLKVFPFGEDLDGPIKAARANPVKRLRYK